MRWTRHAEEEASLGLAPLIDVVLLLLIFFLVASSFVQPRLPLDLPEASTGEAPGPESLVVSLTEDGELRLGEEATQVEALARALEHQAGPETQLLIRADERVPHGRVVEVLDVARGIELGGIGIAVEAGRAPTPGD